MLAARPRHVESADWWSFITTSRQGGDLLAAQVVSQTTRKVDMPGADNLVEDLPVSGERLWDEGLLHAENLGQHSAGESGMTARLLGRFKPPTA